MKAGIQIMASKFMQRSSRAPAGGAAELIVYQLSPQLLAPLTLRLPSAGDPAKKFL